MRALARRTGRRASAAALALVLTSVLAGDAVALCPNCLGQAAELGSNMRLLGVFLLVPFVVAIVAARLIRRACRPPR